MIQSIYIESGIEAHPRTQSILGRFPKASHIRCDRYGEIFNPKAQSFRLQKQQPALILAEKYENQVLPAPDGYGVGGKRNYYFSHMLNCLYDCRYCFLQGMFRSAHYVLFVNYEDFAKEIEKIIARHADEEVWFFSGYDCDSLAMEPVTEFVEYILPLFARNPNAFLELRTKSTQIRGLLDTPPLKNVIVAFSFTTQSISDALEYKVPKLDKRINAMRELQRAGWPVGLRLDPLIYHEDYKCDYLDLYNRLFDALDADKLHSVSLGSFRLPK
ncbi:MAG: DNA photolyase, partial [Gammaproteobacteria bacterium]|nr:DNA photolyase [Gammaproteobacteria bacterium]